MSFLGKLFGSDPSKQSKEYFKLGSQLNNQNDYKGAIDAYTKAIETSIKTDVANIFYNRANAKAKLNDHNGAIEDYTNSISVSKFHETHFDVYYNRGNSKYILKDYIGAIEDYTQTSNINPKFSPAFTSRARAFEKLGKHEEVIKNYIHAIDIDTHALTAKTCLGLATAYYNLNKLDEALKWCEFSLAYNRNLDEAKLLKEEIERKM